MAFTSPWSCFSIEQISTTILILLPLLVMALIFQHRYRTLPPGPTGLPIIGCLLSLGKQPYKTFQKWGQTYGDVFSVRLGTELVVVLNSLEVMKEALVKQSNTFSSRPTNDSFARLLNHKGILVAPSPIWQWLRKFSLRSLHDYGMGKGLTEGRIIDECVYLIEALRKNMDKPIDPRHLIANASSNILCVMLFGRRFAYDDTDFERLLNLANTFVREIYTSALLTFIPILWSLPIPAKCAVQTSVNDLQEHMKMVIEEHKERLKDGMEADCFVDSYLIKIKEYRETKDVDQSLSFLEDNDHLVNTCLGLFTAGSDTTANAVLWAVLFLTLYPDIQTKCYREIEDHIGLERNPTISDRSKLPYIEATTLEVQRLSTIAPLSVPHMTSESVSLRGHFIPKGTMIMTNIWRVHMDEENWKEPETFDPGRFLDGDGNVIGRNSIVPFSLGPRDCPGSELAKMEIFLFLTLLLQTFEFKLAENENPSTEGTLGIIRMPDPFKVIIRERGELCEHNAR